jgi:putative ABC transport system substrate-binding protein
MKRREFIAGAGVAILPLAARAQQRSVPIIGYLSGRSPAETAPVLAEFHRGLREAGYVEGENVELQYRWAEGRYERLPALAADLLERRVNVLAATGGNLSGLAAKAATSIVPIVFVTGGDPVQLGLVSNLRRPNANATGITLYIVELGAKRLDLLRELVPTATRIGLLFNPNYPTAKTEAAEVQKRGIELGVSIELFSAAEESTLDPAFVAMSRQNVQALIIANDPFLLGHRTTLVQNARTAGIPTLYFSREFVEVGGLMSYGSNIGEGYHSAGLYTGHILKGAQPSDLPVLQPTKFELVVNTNTAKSLNLTLSPSLLARFDEVIE